jgi:hypothetical protein
VVVTILFITVWIYHRLELFDDQINNMMLGRSYCVELERQKQANGQYPSRLPSLTSDYPYQRLGIRDGYDYWGHEFHYESKGSAFILVSYGRDGVPDGLDSWKVREENKRHKICGDWDADQVMSDQGEPRICGK